MVVAILTALFAAFVVGCCCFIAVLMRLYYNAKAPKLPPYPQPPLPRSCSCSRTPRSNRPRVPVSPPAEPKPLTPPPLPPLTSKSDPSGWLEQYQTLLPRAWVSKRQHSLPSEELRSCLNFALLANQKEHACRYLSLKPQEFDQIVSSSLN